MIYPNQKKAGKEILTIFSKYSKYVILVAQMQSGKTGTCKYVIKKMIKNHNLCVKNCWYICGMNDNDLLCQTQTEFKKILLRSNILYSKGLQRKHYLAKSEEPSNSKTLIVIDESHYAGCTDSHIDLFIQQITNSETDEIYILSVSATPMAEVVTAKSYNKRVVTLIPDINYYGLSDIYSANLLFQSANICTEFEKFSDDIIAEYERQREAKKWKYLIVRLPNHWYTSDISIDIKELCGNIKFINCHYSETSCEDDGSGGIKTRDFNSYVLLPPKKMTIIWIYNSLRAGKQLNTKNIGMVYDSSNSGTDVTAQALLGRILGYFKKEDKVRCYTDLDSAKRMLGWITSDFSDKTVPLKSKGVLNRPLVFNNWVQHVPICVTLLSEYLEAFRLLKLKNGNRYPYKKSIKTAIIDSIEDKEIKAILELVLGDTYHDGRYGGLMVLTEYNADRSYKEHWESNYKKCKNGELIRGFEVGAEQISESCNKFSYVFVNLHKFSKTYGKCIICYKEYKLDEADLLIDDTCSKLMVKSRYK